TRAPLLFDGAEEAFDGLVVAVLEQPLSGLLVTDEFILLRDVLVLRPGVQHPAAAGRPVQRLMVPLASGGPADPVGAVPPPILSEPLCLLIVEPTNKFLGFRVDDVDPCHRSYTSDL